MATQPKPFGALAETCVYDLGSDGAGVAILGDRVSWGLLKLCMRTILTDNAAINLC